MVEQVVRPTGLVDPLVEIKRQLARWTTCWARYELLSPATARISHDTDQAHGNLTDHLGEHDVRALFAF